MPITGFDHYNLRAPRTLLDTLKEFYCSVLGLTLGERPAFRSFGYWLYAGDQDILHLTEASSEEYRQVNVSSTFDHVAFSCENQAAMEAHLTQHGIEYRKEHVPLTHQQQIFLRDPAGNGVELNFSGDRPGYPWQK